MSESWNPKKVKGTNLKKQNVLPIKEYLDVHYQEKISLDFLAEHFFISKYYLTRVFKEQFGTSINSYLMNRRVTRAKFMLRFSGEKIEAIGYTCGLGHLIISAVFSNRWKGSVLRSTGRDGGRRAIMCKRLQDSEFKGRSSFFKIDPEKSTKEFYKER